MRETLDGFDAHAETLVYHQRYMLNSFVQVVNGAMGMDGGSIALHLLDENGEKHRLLLTQRAQPARPGAEEKPGRLYLDGVLVGIRSSIEASLVEFLRTAPIAQSNAGPPPAKNRLVAGKDLNDYFSAIGRGPDAGLRYLIDCVVSFVRSESYLKLAASIGE